MLFLSFFSCLDGTDAFCVVDGWVYSNDTWQSPRPSPYVAGGGSVTRRRRWVRRVWFDASKAA